MLVMVNGLPGKMAKGIANALYEKDIPIFDYGFSGVFHSNTTYENGVEIDLIDSTSYIFRNSKPDVAVDFTTPYAGMLNFRIYRESGIPFVMGTTGLDMEDIRDYSKTITAVIAPNMSRKIIKENRKIKKFLDEYRNEKLTLKIIESHQSNKKDTSGTAKHMRDYFQSRNTGNVSIESIRNVEEQIKFGVPSEHLLQHAHHKFIIEIDGELPKIIEYRINGMEEYIDGTLEAIKFLDGRGKGLYSMEDVIDWNA